ncbi:hypothetical protein [Pedococcus soli]
MSRFKFGKHDQRGESGGGKEDPVVRQYRYLLRTAPADALEAAHTEAIPLLSTAQQQTLLRSLQDSLLVGGRLGAGDHAKIAHLVTGGERTSPGRLLAALPADVLQRLATSVLAAEASFGLLGGYAHWDGAEPASADAAHEGHGFDPDAGDAKTKRLGADGGAAFGILP